MKHAFAVVVNIEHPVLRYRELLSRSWERSRAAGLTEDGGPGSDAVAPTAGAIPALETIGRPVMEALAGQIAGTPTLVVLADAGGVILATCGDEGFAAMAAPACVLPGANWAESVCGTNAIGTCLVEASALEVSGTDHFLEQLAFLAGVAVPIVVPGPWGDVAGALALFGPAHFPRTHALAMVEMHAGFIEERLRAMQPPCGVELLVHPVEELLGSPLCGWLRFSEDGRLLGRNWRSSSLVPPALEPGARFARGFAADWAEVLKSGETPGGKPLALQTVLGQTLYARVELHLERRPEPAGSGERDLASLGSDDPRIAEAMRKAMRIVECDIPLLIQGETGSGKEWFAQAFHHSGSRRSGPFVAVNCAAIPATLIEAELFGYGEGAFTGARRYGARGKIREADGGTLFLDEIGDMPLALQAVLLRVLETRRVTPLGGDSDEPVNIRLVCASHQPLRDLVGQGAFRADLFFRLSGMTIVLPPLRERSDFDAVVRRIVAEESAERAVRIDAEAFAILRRYSWPGNLRQLRNVLRLSIALLGDDRTLLPVHLPSEVRIAEGHGPATGLRDVQARLARESVDRHGGNISAAARELGITRTTLYRLLGTRAKQQEIPV